MADFEARLENRVESGSCQFWFKQPRMLRLKVLRGSKRGSQVAVDSSGQIRGSRGGILGLIVRRLTTNDPRLLTIRGASILTLDWGSFFVRYRATTLRPDTLVFLAPHPDPNSPFEVTVTYQNEGKAMREIYRLDPHLWVIVEGTVYENETQVAHVVFRDIKLNTGLTESWFRL